MSLIEIILSILIVTSVGFLINYVTSFLFTGLPSLFVVFITCAIALKLLIFVIGRRD